MHFISRSILLLVVAALVFYPRPLVAQSNAWPQTLLWRISGKGLQKPSYLFGTMHVKDRRVFNFPDSLYHFMEKADGYAMEIEPDKISEEYYKFVVAADTSPLIKKALPANTYRRISELLRNRYDLDADTITLKTLWLLKNDLPGYPSRENDMSLPMDLYLYQYAADMDKWTGGIEDIADQFDPANELVEAGDIEKFFITEAQRKEFFEPLITNYLAANLNALEQYSYNEQDTIFIRRNHKMARRMDSLARVRSMFMAVGAAHLPGREGVINLLRRKGYTLTPVFYTHKIPADQYANLQQSRKWKKWTAPGKLFALELPGTPIDNVHGGDIMKMHYYSDDLTQSMFFIAHMPNVLGEASIDSVMKLMGERLSKNMEVKSKKRIIIDSILGIEIVATLPNAKDMLGRLFVIPHKDVIVMMMYSAMDKTKLFGQDCQRFAQSLRINRAVPVPVAAQAGAVFTDSIKAFSVKPPGSFSKLQKEDKMYARLVETEEEGLEYTVYAGGDYKNAIIYYLYVFDVKSGFTLSADSSHYSDLVALVREMGVQQAKTTYGQRHGCRTMTIAGVLPSTNQYVQLFAVWRGSRIYRVYSISPNTPTAIASVQPFFDSFSLLDYVQPPGAGMYTEPGGSFRTWTPEPILPVLENEQDSTYNKWLSYDPATAVNLMVEKTEQHPYFWLSNDSSTLVRQLAAFLSPGDHIEKFRNVQNGNVKGIELLISKPAAFYQHRTRILFKNNYTYLLTCEQPHDTTKRYERFFEDFRFTDEKNETDIFTNKTPQLFADLSTTDSVLLERAYSALSSFTPLAEDLPLLHGAFVKKYHLDDTDVSPQMRTRLGMHIARMQAPATVEYIGNLYPQLSGDADPLRMDLLDLLIDHKTSAAYQLFKKLTTKYPLPRKGDNRLIFQGAMDTLTLARTLLPELLQLSSDTLFGFRMSNLLRMLVDSNYLDKGQLRTCEPGILALAKTKLPQVRASDEIAYEVNSFIRLMALFNDEPANAMLQQYARVPKSYIQYAAVKALLANTRMPEAAVLQQLAADKLYRVDLYELLREYKKDAAFPERYRNRKAIAESIMYNIASEEEEPEEFAFAAMHTLPFKGKQYDFFLFKIKYATEDDDARPLLGIVGPYLPGSKRLIPVDKITVNGVLSGEVFDKDRLGDLLLKYLAQFEEESEDDDVKIPDEEK